MPCRSLSPLVHVAVCILLVGNGCRPTRDPAPVTPPQTERQAAVDGAPVASLLPGIETMSGPQVYVELCSGCHGKEGDGRGSSRQYVWPPPRNFRHDRFRLVNTTNRVPTLDTIEAVIRNGLPGTGMASFRDLSDGQRSALAEEVLRMRGEGVRERLLESYGEDASDMTEEELAALVQAAMTPDEVVNTPTFDTADPQSVDRGASIYRRQSCHACHGDDGVGAWDVRLRTDEGYETRPRDLVHEHFRGGHDSASIYLRLALGMPGTPHPASTNLAEADLIDLVNYCRWLSKEPKRVLPGYAARAQASARDYLKALGRTPPTESR